MRASPVVVCLAACALTSCSSLSGTTEVPPQVVLGPVPTGALPEPVTVQAEVPPPPTVAPTSTSTTEPRERLDGPVAQNVDGNRVLVIGDTVLAATAPRNDGETCRTLVEFGWDVEIDTEPGRFVEFGRTVVDARFQPDDGLDWDVIVVMLGNHFDGDLEAFELEYDRLLESVAPRPVVLFTVSELEPGQSDINAFIRSRVRSHPNIVVIDWAELSSGEPERLLDDGGPVPTDEGADRLTLFLAAALGQYSVFERGECLEPAFFDDSAILL